MLKILIQFNIQIVKTRLMVEKMVFLKINRKYWNLHFWFFSLKYRNRHWNWFFLKRSQKSGEKRMGIFGGENGASPISFTEFSSIFLYFSNHFHNFIDMDKVCLIFKEVWNGSSQKIFFKTYEEKFSRWLHSMECQYVPVLCLF